MHLTINKKTFKGFTLVELIIVITILAILGTIAYISFQGYTKDARDGVRMSDIKQIYNGLSIYKTQTEKTLLPDNYINIQSGTTTISYQGYAGTNILRTLKMTGGKDPGTKDYYIYTTDVNTKKAQLMTYMETSDKDIQYLSQFKSLKLIDQSEALTNTGYYQDKKIYVYGDKIGILTNNKIPLQETTTNTGIDITTLTGSITTYFGGNVYSGGVSTSTGLTLINQINGAVTNTLPCSNTTYNSYTITSLQDKQSLTFTKTGLITNGSQTGSIVATCNNGTLSYSSETIQTSCNVNHTLNGNSCDLNKYIVSGTITNGSGGTINLCGTTTNIDSSGNFTLSNINYGINCSGITIIRSGYNCSISTDGPNNLSSNINNITGSCTIIPYYSGGGTNGNPYRLSGVASNATTTLPTGCQYYNLNATTNNAGNARGAGTCGNGSQECLTSGVYLIDPDGSGGNNAFQTYCDMVNNSGGWTLCASFGMQKLGGGTTAGYNYIDTVRNTSGPIFLDNSGNVISYGNFCTSMSINKVVGQSRSGTANSNIQFTTSSIPVSANPFSTTANAQYTTAGGSIATISRTSQGSTWYTGNSCQIMSNGNGQGSNICISDNNSNYQVVLGNCNYPQYTIRMGDRMCGYNNTCGTGNSQIILIYAR